MLFGIIYNIKKNIKTFFYYIRKVDIGDIEANETAEALGANASVGKWTYAGSGSKVYAYNKSDRVVIGKFCSIADYVKFFPGGGHGHRTRASTYPFNVKMMRSAENTDATSKGPIIIGNDVWIGSHAIILSGVSIGDGAVIGAGSVISKNVPPYAIAVGNPAKIAGYRFSGDIIAKLMSIKWWDWNDKKIEGSLNYFYGNIGSFVEKHYIAG